MPKTKGTKADTVKKVTVDDLLPVLENTDFKLDEQPYPLYLQSIRKRSVIFLYPQDLSIRMLWL